MMVDRRDEGAREGEGASNEAEGGERWREVVRLLEDNARARTRLEAVETALLREARACDVPARLGYVSLEEFAERHLGYGRHAANERCRVSLELEALPQLCAAYEDGTLMFSHVRELTRVATRPTQADWLSAAKGKSVREISLEPDLDFERAARETAQALRDGVDVVYQGVLVDGDWRGVADFLERGEDGSYEALDTKLARSGKPAHILQPGRARALGVGQRMLEQRQQRDRRETLGDGFGKGDYSHVLF